MKETITIDNVVYEKKAEQLSTHIDVDANDKRGQYLIGKYVIVRCKDAGVHSGILVDYYDRTVTLKNSKWLWYWQSNVNSFLSGCAVSGVTDKSKTGDAVNFLILTEACQIIETSKEAEKSIINAPVVERTND